MDVNVTKDMILLLTASLISLGLALTSKSPSIIAASYLICRGLLVFTILMSAYNSYGAVGFLLAIIISFYTLSFLEAWLIGTGTISKTAKKK